MKLTCISCQSLSYRQVYSSNAGDISTSCFVQYYILPHINSLCNLCNSHNDQSKIDTLGLPCPRPKGYTN